MMRIIWGLYDSETQTLEALFEAENLLVGYREQLLRKWYDDMTVPLIARDYLPGEEYIKALDDAHNAERDRLLDLGYERWRNDQVNDAYPRYRTQKYELWNSVPPNVERLVLHFDT